MASHPVEMTLEDLRSISERQRIQMHHQKDLIYQREQHLQHLKASAYKISHLPGGLMHNNSVTAIQNGIPAINGRSQEMTAEDEINLQKLRSLRGQAEKFRILHDSLVKDINSLKHRHELDSGELASLTQKLDIVHQEIRNVEKWRQWLDSALKITVQFSHDFSKLSSVCHRRPDFYPSSSSPFNPQLYTKEKLYQWKNALKRAEYHDQCFGNRQFSFPKPPGHMSSPNKLSLPMSRHDSKSPTRQSDSSSFRAPQHPHLSRPVQPPPRSTSTSRKSTGIDYDQPDFPSSVLAKAGASSPPSQRRASLMLLLNSGAAEEVKTSENTLSVVSNPYNRRSHPLLSDTNGQSLSVVSAPNPRNTVSRQKSTEATIIALGRAKTPPRYASRTIINETYMRGGQLSKEVLEKYKKNAAAILGVTTTPNSDRSNLNHSELKPITIPGAAIQNIRLIDQTDVPKAFENDDDNEDTASTSSSLELNGIINEKDVIEISLKEQVSSKATIKISPPRNISKAVESNSPDEVIDVNSNPVNDFHNPKEMQEEEKEETSHFNGESNSIVPSIKAKSPTVSTDESVPEIYVAPLDPKVRPILRKRMGNYTPRQSTPGLMDKTSSPLMDSALMSGGTNSFLDQRSTANEEKRLSDDSVLNGSSIKNIVRFHPLALLLDAALEGDVNLVKKVAKEVEDVSEPNDEGITALHNAVCAGRMEIAEFLVREAGADVNAGDTDGWTPLHCAASCANLSLARLLVEHGAALHARTLSDQETPLEKCDHVVDDDADCEDYLNFEHERLGTASNGQVYAIFDRYSSFPGESPLRNDELEFHANDELRIIDKTPENEPEWMLAEHINNGKKGLVPRAFISSYPLLKVPKQWHQRINWGNYKNSNSGGYEIEILQVNDNSPSNLENNIQDGNNPSSNNNSTSFLKEAGVFKTLTPSTPV